MSTNNEREWSDNVPDVVREVLEQQGVRKKIGDGRGRAPDGFEPKTASIAVRIMPSQYAAWRAAASARHVSLNSLIGHAVDAYLAGQGATPDESAITRAADEAVAFIRDALMYWGDQVTRQREAEAAARGEPK